MSQQSCAGIHILLILHCVHDTTLTQLLSIVSRSSWRLDKKVMIYGVVRSDGQGVPKFIKQKDAK